MPDTTSRSRTPSTFIFFARIATSRWRLHLNVSRPAPLPAQLAAQMAAAVCVPAATNRRWPCAHGWRPRRPATWWPWWPWWSSRRGPGVPAALVVVLVVVAPVAMERGVAEAAHMVAAMATGQRQPPHRAAAVAVKPSGPVAIPAQIVVKDLAELLNVSVNEVIRDLITLGIFASINEVVTYDAASKVAEQIGYTPEEAPIAAAAPAVAVRPEAALIGAAAHANDVGRISRPPVVTVMGHVDHGKTSLLDAIRNTQVAAGEAGGITQHIGAYQVEVNGRKITFLDTPGHEAFTQMRARGAQVTDIAVIVVAADDGVMPQTIEAIDHARAAQVPLVVALNKIDRPNANPDHVKQQLADHGVVIEEYGGEVVCVPVSAKKQTGITELLEMILLVADLQDLKANPNGAAHGVVIEARLDQNTGVAANALIQDGTLKIGDTIVVGTISGRVSARCSTTRASGFARRRPARPSAFSASPRYPPRATGWRWWPTKRPRDADPEAAARPAARPAIALPWIRSTCRCVRARSRN